MIRFILALAVMIFATSPLRAETVSFQASDGVTVTADVSRGASNTVIVLFHMAGASRGEYQRIAPALNSLGYTTLAVDQRSGRAFGGVKNETAARVGGKSSFLAAVPDLKAAVAYARRSLGATRVGVVGSSYSASLVLVLAGQDRGFADAVMSFSPGEYFPDRSLVRKSAAGITVPVFITAARNEASQWKPFADVLGGRATGFIPRGAGKHGATTLLTDAREEYWAALRGFLQTNLPAR